MATKLNFVAKARKDYPAHGIKKGESYFWWKFRFGGKHFSKVRPPASQLINSPFLRSIAEAGESLDAASVTFTEDHDFEQLATSLEEIAQTLRDLGEEAGSSFDNMPEGLQQGETGQLLEARRDRCDEIATELDDAATEIRDFGNEDEDTPEEERIESAESKVGELSIDCE